MPSDPDSLAGDLIRAVEILGEVVDLDSIRREWSAVSLGEDERSAWLEDEILATQR